MNNLDKILKEQMEQFAPEAPNVWAGIETGIKNNAGSSAGSGNAAAGSKIGLGILKVLAIASLPAAFIAYSYFANPNTDNKQAVVATQQEAQEKETVNQRLVTEPTEKEMASNKITITYADNQTNKANKKTTIVKELTNHNNAEALNNQANLAQNQEISSNQTITKTEAKPKPDNQQILQSELKDESNLHEEIESSKKEEEVEKPKEESGEVILKNLTNVLTPNNDGLNDKYLIEIEGEKYYNLKIYNTQNELVFESSDKLNNWDGTHFKTGQACGSGTYYGILIYRGANQVDLKTLKTAIQLIR